MKRKPSKNYFGKLVVVAHWSDFKLEDATKLGILKDIRDGYFYVDGDSRGYRFCRLVSRQCIRADVSNLEQKAKDRLREKMREEREE